MRVLIACEYSGIVRDAFLDAGHVAVSCDVLPCESSREIPPHTPYNGHFQGDIFCLLDVDTEWDLMIAHPPCTHLSVSGAWCFTRKEGEPGFKPESLRTDALQFVQDLMNVDIPRIAIENPVSVISSRIRKPNQYIQPYQFGHPEQKKTGLWLKNLPLLKESNNVHDEMMKLDKKDREKILNMSGKDRGKLRSRFYQGIATAMTQQWGELNEN